ncbi:MAG: 2'-5' RNA ligase family protein [Deltaproteobacteria bacterium]|nr:2'-5' RNA ligase family protein [Deltaproteobacteria bacterium]
MKTHHTAVVIIPPGEIWGPIQAIRQRHDQQFHRWMPHITPLYPFRPR